MNRAVNMRVAIYAACCLSKFYAQGIKNRRFLILYSVYGYL